MTAIVHKISQKNEGLIYGTREVCLTKMERGDFYINYYWKYLIITLRP